MGAVLELQKRVPERWILRRLLPSAVFVGIAYVGTALGYAHWNGIALAKQQLTFYLEAASGSSAYAASLAIFALLASAGAFAAPLVAQFIGSLAAGAWPWWLAPLSDRVSSARKKHWRSPEELRKDALDAGSRGKQLRAARLKALAAATRRSAPTTPTWIGDRLEIAATHIEAVAGVDVRTSFIALLLRLPDNARTALADAREGYDAACEGLAWSLAYAVLGLWWWPAFFLSATLGTTSWRWLRRAAEALAATAEAVAATDSKPEGETNP